MNLKVEVSSWDIEKVLGGFRMISDGLQAISDNDLINSVTDEKNVEHLRSLFDNIKDAFITASFGIAGIASALLDENIDHRCNDAKKHTASARENPQKEEQHG